MLINSDGTTASIYLGTRGDTPGSPGEAAEALYNYIRGNFQGSLGEYDDISVKEKALNEIIDTCFQGNRFISSVSGVPSIRRDEIENNAEFSQGLEKLLDAMRGKAFAAIFIADCVSPDELADIRAEYELLYSTLAPFAKSTLTLNDSQSDGITKSLSQSLANTVGTSTSASLSIGTNQSQSHQEGTSIGHAGTAGVGIGIPVANANYSHSIQRTQSFSDSTSFGNSRMSTKTEGESTAQTTATVNTDGTTTTYTTGKSLQISYENKSVTELLSKIDAQLERIKASESFGMFAAAAYFIAPDQPTVETAASTYKAIISGRNTGLEAAAINIWDGDSGCYKGVERYLKLVRHPVFKLDDLNQVTPASLISAQELAILMGLPNQSAAGVTVIESAPFGRNIIRVDGTVQEVQKGETIRLGSLYHMGQTLGSCPVELDKQSMAMHTFITGSTGSGKSNTVFQLLNELKKTDVHFLIVEPAKGEYKHVFAGSDVTVYGTNPKVTELLRINPFSFPKEIHVLEHLDRLVEIFNVCWPMYAAMPAVLKDAIERAYTAAGWDLKRSENRYGSNLFPTFADVLEQIETVMEQSQYSSDSKGDYKGALCTRLRSLTNGINSLIFTSGELSRGELFDNNVIVDLSRVGSSETKSLIMGLLVMKLQEHRMASAEGMNQKLQHVTVLEEAHNLLKMTSTEQSTESANLLGKSVEMLTNAIAEMRTYGEGFIIADQSPELLDRAAIRNTNTKIIMRLPAYADRELVGRAAGLNDAQIQELSRLDQGVAAVYQNSWVEAVLCKVDKFTPPEAGQGGSVQPSRADVDVEAQESELLCALVADELPKYLETHDRQVIVDGPLPTAAKCAILDCMKERTDVRTAEKRALYALLRGEELFERTSNVSDSRVWLDSMKKELGAPAEDFSEEDLRFVLKLLILEYGERHPERRDHVCELAERGGVIR